MTKTPEIENFLDNLSLSMFGRSRKDSVCVFCGSTAVNPEDFIDDLSRKEYSISHICQQCQDKVFN